MYVNDTFFKNLDSYLSQAEKFGNYPEYFLGPYIGPYRILIGKVMMAAFSTLAASHLMIYAWETEKNIDHLYRAKQYGGYVVHGALNVLRGMVATQARSGGFFFLFVYDLSHHRFHYSFETLRKGEHTLNPYHQNFPA